MSNLLVDSNNSSRSTLDPSRAKDAERKSKDYRITAFALVIIALILFAAGNFLFGIGTLPTTLMTGMGYFYVIGGAFTSVIALGVFTGALVSGVVSLVKAPSVCGYRAVID